jgi:hypothetical protein
MAWGDVVDKALRYYWAWGNVVVKELRYYWAWGNVVVKALRYYSEGPGIDPKWYHWGFFLWHPTIPYVRGLLSL